MQNNLDIKKLFSQKQLDKRLHHFCEITNLSLVIQDQDANVFFASQSGNRDAYAMHAQIVVNGETLATLSGYGSDKQKIAFDFIHGQLEDLLNNEFTRQDLVKTTANFWKELNFLYNLMYDIGSVLDVPEMCEIINKKIIKVIGVQHAQIMLLDECGDLIPMSRIGNIVHTPLDSWVFENGTSLLINDVGSVPAEVENIQLSQLNDEIFPVLAVPIKVRGDLLGVLKVAQKTRDSIFSTDDLKLLNSIGYQIALAVHNAFMINRLRVTEKIEKEMELASKIQKELLPKHMPVISGLDVDGRCISANAVGGDYFDYFTSDDFCNFVLADVSGHGVSAALFMSNVRSSLRGLFSERIPLSEVAYRMNNFIVSDAGTSGMFVTLFYVRYYLKEHTLEFINSGQTPPILHRGSTGEIIRLETGGSPAGFFENMTFEVKTERLYVGDTLVIYTDGFVEAINEKGIRFGEKRLLESVEKHHGLPVRQLIDHLYNDVHQFTRRPVQQDDMTILVIKRKD